MEFSVVCQVCKSSVDSFTQSIRFLILPDSTVTERESIELSCGCTVDFPEWRIDMDSGICQIYNFAETLYITFYDEEMLNEEED
jgi:hypothetical protein